MRIYLDHNATTPLRDEVREAMQEPLRSVFGNPSSGHAEGAAARRLVEIGREQVAACLGVTTEAIIFGAGATEANNCVLLAPLLEGVEQGHVVVTAVEHPSVLEPAAFLESRGFRITRVPVDAEGRVDPEQVEQALRPDTVLVSVIWANNETGVIQPIEEIARRVRARGATLHVDATQAVGKWPVDLSRLELDHLSLSAHKLGGPKGVGCLVSPGARPPRLLRGGGQERGLRGGTLNVAGIVGLGRACELARKELAGRMQRDGRLRDRLWAGIEKSVPGARRNGSTQHVLPNTLSVEFPGASGELLLQALDLEGVAVSAGAACHSGSISPSHVLVAMGRSAEQARDSLRFSVGAGVDEAQIDRVVGLLPELVARAREAEAS